MNQPKVSPEIIAYLHNLFPENRYHKCSTIEELHVQHGVTQVVKHLAHLSETQAKTVFTKEA